MNENAELLCFRLRSKPNEKPKQSVIFGQNFPEVSSSEALAGSTVVVSGQSCPSAPVDGWIIWNLFKKGSMRFRWWFIRIKLRVVAAFCERPNVYSRFMKSGTCLLNVWLWNQGILYLVYLISPIYFPHTNLSFQFSKNHNCIRRSPQLLTT